MEILYSMTASLLFLVVGSCKIYDRREVAQWKS